jgi:hypothetical protein
MREAFGRMLNVWLGVIENIPLDRSFLGANLPFSRRSDRLVAPTFCFCGSIAQ